MNIDFTSMVVNLSQSAPQVQALVSGFGYIMGFIFIFVGIQKLRNIADYRARSSSQIPIIVPIAYICGGALLIYLPKTIQVFSATFFGADNVLSYEYFSSDTVEAAMILLIQTAGVIWFVRGTNLIINASNPGIQHGPKGLAFLIAGILAINFEGTVSWLYAIFNKFASFTLSFISNLGYSG